MLLCQLTIILYNKVPCKSGDLYQHVKEFLTMKSGYFSQRKIYMFIDAFNQLDKLDLENTELNPVSSWLPSILPPHIKCIISMTPGSTLFQNLERSNNFIVERIPELTFSQRGEIVEVYLSRYRKTLERRQERIFVEKCSLPLWIIVACDELRLFGEFKLLTEYIEKLPNKLDELVLLVCCSDYEIMYKDGKPLKPRLIAWKWCTVFRHLRTFIRPYGNLGEGRLNFYHQSMSDVEYPYHLMMQDDRVNMKSFLLDWEVFDRLYNSVFSKELIDLWRFIDQPNGPKNTSLQPNQGMSRQIPTCSRSDCGRQQTNYVSVRTNRNLDKAIELRREAIKRNGMLPGVERETVDIQKNLALQYNQLAFLIGEKVKGMSNLFFQGKKSELRSEGLKACRESKAIYDKIRAYSFMLDTYISEANLQSSQTEAHKIYAKLIRDCISIHGAEHNLVVRASYNDANIYEKEKNFLDAYRGYKVSYLLGKKLLGPKHTSTLQYKDILLEPKYQAIMKEKKEDVENMIWGDDCLELLKI
ncbi:hypothetical protein HELRODRAFT_171054 [Helobdella robusta]|uniref:Uncharacterized protein n=1 Tax=Helobdella robusta TaxID=6412 RepID=T1F3R6_HELRO|nr:hypothetical protein HELRODRAFT_171054 [Helobdella robusta]ESO07016.1 hypothetical protein HELRODRAFT_171054 [Helobdella robusta]